MKKLYFLTSLILSFISFPAFATPVPDTGQTKCYNNTEEIPCPKPREPFYGQDAQYASNTQSYTDLGNGIIQDNVTGLMWQKETAPGTYTWDLAHTYCENLTLGGYSDWRLPTIKEFSFIRNFSFNPTINIEYFPNTQLYYYWSSTRKLDNAFYINFSSGLADRIYITNAFFVRAVRGVLSDTPERFIDNDDGTVTDKSTKLMWQQSTAAEYYTWEHALSYCEDLVLAGYDDWRLPNVNELQSLMDYSTYHPAIDISYFPDTSFFYITSTTRTDKKEYALIINSFYGENYFGQGKKIFPLLVRAVRNYKDTDNDLIDDRLDNCPFIANGKYNGTCITGSKIGDNCTDNAACGTGGFCSMNQEDSDNDTVGDVCDNCIATVNPLQFDCDNDTVGDACDPDFSDNDNDGYDDACDNCTDSDGDSFGDSGFPENTCPVDVCPNDPDNDIDNDTICGDVDNCQQTPNGTELGSCVKIVAGVFISTGKQCEDNGACEEDELCEVYQLDINGNGIGDVCECYADLSGDGKVNSKDLLIMKIDYNRKDCFVNPCNADCNDDGNVNSSDLLIMKLQYNRSGCPIVNCPNGLLKCNNICIDINTDVNNCGQCGIICDNEEECINGFCQFVCPNEFIECDGLCFDNSTNKENCGKCGNICQVDEVCNNGECVYPPLYIEVDISSGPNSSLYPVTEFDIQPSLTDDYKTRKILLRKIDSSGTPFTMGSPTNEAGRYGDEIQHKVILTQDYYMGVFEITQKQYELVIGENPSTYFGYMKPVESISWDTIRGGDWPGTPPGTGQPATDTFIYKLRDKTGLNFDLPTEAQWEYACRATTIRAFNDYTINGGDGPDCTVPYGNSDPGLDPLGRYSFNGNYADRHVVVGSYQPNLWGLYDMHGNVWEWCLDWYASYRLDAIDPLGDKWGDGWDYTRVRRGGSWVRSAGDCRSATRLRSHTSFADDQIGFRLSIQK